jgi:hypothetical protein
VPPGGSSLLIIDYSIALIKDELSSSIILRKVNTHLGLCWYFKELQGSG